MLEFTAERWFVLLTNAPSKVPYLKFPKQDNQSFSEVREKKTPKTIASSTSVLVWEEEKHPSKMNGDKVCRHKASQACLNMPSAMQVLSPCQTVNHLSDAADIQKPVSQLWRTDRVCLLSVLPGSWFAQSLCLHTKSSVWCLTDTFRSSGHRRVLPRPQNASCAHSTVFCARKQNKVWLEHRSSEHTPTKIWESPTGGSEKHNVQLAEQQSVGMSTPL